MGIRSGALGPIDSRYLDATKDHWEICKVNSRNVPILITAFNRPEKLKSVVDALVGIENEIFFWFDGPRVGTNDKRQIDLSVEIAESSSLNISGIVQNLDNVGTNSVATGISWILQKFDSVIVIEEDVMVSHAFISFAEEMLEKYEADFRIGSITSMNLVPASSISEPNDPYRFSSFFYAWGWATWANRWNKMPDGTSHWDYSKIHWPKTARNKLSQSRWLTGMNAVRDGSEPGLWDYRWIYTYWVNSWLTIVPNSNLGTNIGFDHDATHTRMRPSWVPQELSISITGSTRKKEIKVAQDVKADRWAAKNVHSSSFLVVLKTKIKKYLNQTLLKA